jgi:hypothetical protein
MNRAHKQPSTAEIMKTRCSKLVRFAAVLGLAACNLSAGTLCVSLLSTNPVPPYSTWATAATNIQDAVDAAHAGDTVLVTNGVYAVGTRENEWTLSRVAVTNAIRLESLNGPLVTTIDGGGSVRCVYLGSNAVLSGFTLTNGAVRGCSEGFCSGLGGGAYGGTLTNCTVTGNWAGKGGGAFGSTLNNCTLSENKGSGKDGSGGGAYASTLYNCTLTGNSAFIDGGGAYASTLYNCTLTGNSGSGASLSTLYDCTLTGNSRSGAWSSTLINCTVTGNDDVGVGSDPWDVGSTLYNSIIYGNTNGNYTELTILNYCLTTPLPTSGIGNIAADPGFVNAAAGDYHLLPDSPCIDGGTNLLGVSFTYWTGRWDPDTGEPIMGVGQITDPTDIVGNPRFIDGNFDGRVAWDIGAYEFRPSPLTLYVSLQSTTPVSPYSTWATAATNIQHAVDAAKAGDTVLVTNGVYAVGNRGEWWNLSRVVVTNSIRLESVNGPLVTTVQGAQEGWGIRCVYLGSNAALNGFTLANGGAQIFGGGVSSEPSGVVTNCTLTGNLVMSLGLPPRGGGAYGGTLYNCTLTGNSSYWSGGGASQCALYNCTLAGNSAGYRGGGGASQCTLYNCILNGNWAHQSGGGACGSTLYNCTLTGNSAIASEYGGGFSGGASGSTLYNCTVTGNDGGGVGYDNWATGSTVFNSIVYYNFGGNYAEGTTLNYCCTTPLPTNGVGNISGSPLFVDWDAGDFRLREESPCIDAGTNLLVLNVGYTFEPTDMLGNTRFIDGDFDGTVAWDMGAYEFNSFRPPRFTSGPQLTPDGWKLNITGAANQWVRLQRSSDLRTWEDVPWSSGGTVFMGAEGVGQLYDRQSYYEGQKVMFYRAVVE